MSDAIFSKWVAFWGNATSISDRKESVYAKNITLRYPVYCPFDGNKIRLHFSNLTGTEPVVLSKVFVSTERDGFKPYPVKYMKKNEFSIEPGSEIVSDTV